LPTALINGTPIFYEDTGTGAPLVLVHGSWVDRTSWDAVTPALRERFRVVTVDLRGHGRSRLEPPDAGTVHDDVADLAALVEHLGIAPVYVAGISSGACITLRLASEHASLVRQAFAHEPPCMTFLAGDPENEPLLDAVGETMGQVIARVAAGDHRGAAEQFFDAVVGLPWSELSADQQDMIAAHAAAFGGQMQDPDAIVLDPDRLRSITAEVVLSEGEQSPPFFTLINAKLLEAMPTAQRHELAGAGHVPQMTHPDAYVELISRSVGV
jgi:pimeloyl-ACP methyl ester carboxylesterase